MNHGNHGHFIHKCICGNVLKECRCMNPDKFVSVEPVCRCANPQPTMQIPQQVDDDDQEIKRIPIAEFRRLGFLQEINRRILHPCGLAMEVIIDDETGEETLGGVWDYREDPEGIYYKDNELSADKARSVDELYYSKAHCRLDNLGYSVQPATGASALETCGECTHAKHEPGECEVINFYSRGPNDPPGNQRCLCGYVVPIPDMVSNS